MVYLIVLVLLVGTVWLVGGPLLRARPGRAQAVDRGLSATEAAHTERRIDLEAARDAKYREIRDAELDHQTGKLSDADFRAIDSTLRAEALELLKALDALEAADAPDDPDAPNGAE
jgi:acetyl-CoA acetyltransferase